MGLSASIKPSHHPKERSMHDISDSMEKGVQPLDTILLSLKLSNHDLVQASQDQLTHKMVAKGRKGRKLTLNGQNKILRALNASQSKKVYLLSELFNY